jgi:protein TonB
MSTIEISLYSFMASSSSFPLQPERSSLYERIAVVGLVILLHAAVLAAYWLQPEMPAVMVNELSISFANMQMQQADVAPQPKPKPRETEPLPVEKNAEKPVEKEEVQPAAQNATPPSPVLLDAEPDYRADYLHNPRPPYPQLATRMGWQGKVILNVEVLDDGKAGQVLLHKSCGHEILDNAALQTVKSWRFTPARRFGHTVTEWFLVPVVFKLEDS